MEDFEPGNNSGKSLRIFRYGNLQVFKSFHSFVPLFFMYGIKGTNNSKIARIIFTVWHKINYNG